MKTKIYVCGNSEIFYVSKTESIEPIPIILSFSKEEEYNDGVDMNSLDFYNRLRYDENAKVTVKSQKFLQFCNYIERSIADGYDQILFILGNRNYGDIFISTMLVKSQYSNVPIYIYSSDLISYPLANMAIEADNMLKNGTSMEDVFSKLDILNKEYQMYFYAPKEDVRYVYPRNFLVDPKIVLPKKRVGYKYTGKLEDFFPKKKQHVLYSMVDEIINTNSKKIFLLYSSKTSELYKYFKKYISERLPEGITLEEYPIPPAIGVGFGVNSIGIGCINN